MKLRLLVALLPFLLFNCAQRGNPSGGEGDITPPLFVKSVPATEQLNVPVDGSIELRFNEWVEPVSAEKAVTVHPIITDGYEVKTSARKVTIKAKNGFAKNTTYHVSVNSELTDFYKNRMVEPVTIVFSTGEKIDSGVIMGAAILENDDTDKPLKVSLFRASRLDSTTDTTLLTEPDYFTQCDTLGRFEFKNINEGSYRIVGFRDENGDNLLTPGEMGFVPDEPIVSTEKLEEYILNRVATDTTTLTVTKPSFRNAYTLTATVNLNGVVPDSMKIVSMDTVDAKTYRSEEYHLLHDSVTLVATFKDSIPSAQYELFSYTNNPISAGIHNVDTIDTLPYMQILVDTVRFNAITEADSTTPELKGWKVIKNNSIRPEIALTWSVPVKAEGNFSLEDTMGKSFSLKVTQEYDTELIFTPLSPLPRETELTMNCHLSQFSSFNDIAPDSVDTSFAVKTVAEKDVALSLLVNYPECEEFLSWKWFLNSLDGKEQLEMTKTTEGFVKEELPATQYTVTLLEDKNSDGIYNSGSLFPHVPGEKRVFLPDTLKAKGRWRTELILETNCLLLKEEVIPEVDSAAVQDSVVQDTTKEVVQ